MTFTTERCRTFQQLHRSGCFVMPNPWDVGGARLLAQLGFPAVATTSSGFAWSLGRSDNRGTVARGGRWPISGPSPTASRVPVNADFEGGFAIDPSTVAANVARAMTTGIAGLSIEDSTGDPSKPLLDFSVAVERIRAARHVIDDSGTGVLLTGRSEGVSSSDSRIWRKRSAGSPPTPKPAPTVSTHRASAASRISVAVVQATYPRSP